MEKIAKAQAEQLFADNSENLFVVTLNGKIFQALNVAAYIGFSERSIKNLFESFFDAFPVDVSGYKISLISDVKKIEDLRGLFLDDMGNINSYERVFLADYGYIEKQDIFSFDEDKIQKIKELLLKLKDNDHFYTLLNQDGSAYYIDGHQPVFFDYEDAYMMQFKVEKSRVMDIGEIVMPFFFKDTISDFAKVVVNGIKLSGRELNEVFRQYFMDTCINKNEIFEIVQNPLYIYYSVDGSNLMMQHYGQTIFFTDLDILRHFDTGSMPVSSDPLRVDDKHIYSDIITSEYVFFDGEKHCSVKDFYMVGK